MADEAFTEEQMVVVDGIRYRPEDTPAPKLAEAPPKKAPAKRPPAAENKARTVDPAADAGESGTVASK